MQEKCKKWSHSSRLGAQPAACTQEDPSPLARSSPTTLTSLRCRPRRPWPRSSPTWPMPARRAARMPSPPSPKGSKLACPQAAKMKLLTLTQEDSEYDRWSKSHLSILDVFEEYASLKVTLSRFVEVAPKMQSRLYSIASSPMSRGKNVELCCRVATYTASPKRSRESPRGPLLLHAGSGHLGDLQDQGSAAHATPARSNEAHCLRLRRHRGRSFPGFLTGKRGLQKKGHTDRTGAPLLRLSEWFGISCIRVCCSDGTRRASARSSCPSRVQRTEVRKNTCIMLFEGILQRFWDFWMTAMQVDTSTSAALPPLWPRMLPMSWLICWATWLDWTWLRQSAKGCQAIRARFFPTFFFRHKGDKGDASTGFTKLTDLQEKGRVIFDVWGWTERSAHDSSPRSKNYGQDPAPRAKLLRLVVAGPHVSA